MRNLKRNQLKLYYASYIGSEAIVDEYGNQTLEEKKTYSEPKTLRVNFSPNAGEMYTETFGNVSNYSRVLTYVGNVCPLKEKDVLWINETYADTVLGRALLGEMIFGKTYSANYEVVKVADGLNSFLIAVQEIV